MARIVKEAEPFERFTLGPRPGDRPVQRPETAAESRAHADRAGRARAGELLPPGRVPGPVPRPAHPARRQDQSVQAAVGGRHVLEGRRPQPAAAAAVRHGLVQQEGPAAVPGPGRGSQTPRPSRAGQEAAAVRDRGRTWAPGLCLWLPKGACVRSILEEFIKRELLARGYQPVYSPHIGRVELYETSGHFPYYRDVAVRADLPPRGRADRRLPAPHAWQAGEGAGPCRRRTRSKLIEAAQVLGLNAADCGYRAGRPAGAAGRAACGPGSGSRNGTCSSR